VALAIQAGALWTLHRGPSWSGAWSPAPARWS